MDGEGGYLRIGELARRTGVSPELLRAWEQRYDLLRPSRSNGGFRLYSDEDERRVRRTAQLIAGGLSAAQAASQALDDARTSTPRPQETDPRTLEALTTRLATSLDVMDGEEAHRAIDRLLSALSVDGLLQDVALPYLRELGDRWARGEVSVAQEHFASSLIRGRLLGIARDWGAGVGPSVVLACVPGEAHDIGLISFGMQIGQRGWRVIFLGADTPIDAIESTARSADAALVVLAVTDMKHVRAQAEAIRELAAVVPVALGGEVTQADAQAVGARALLSDPVGAAREVAREHRRSLA